MKKLIALIATVVLVTPIGVFAQATPQPPQCYNLAPFSDIITLNHVTQGNNQSLYGNWTASNAYSIPVVGAREPNLNGGPKRVSLHGTNDTGDFNANPICALDGVIGGAFAITCVGGPNGTFTVSGTAFTLVTCTANQPREGQAAGKSQGK